MLAYNNKDYSVKCIEGILKNTKYPFYELIIVDNNSTDGSKEYFKSVCDKYPNVKVAYNSQNYGFSGGNNVGVENAQGDIVVLLNNDTYPLNGWLFELVKVLMENPNIGAVCPTTNAIGNEPKMTISFDNIPDLENKMERYWSSTNKFVKKISMVAFFCVAIKKTLWDEVGMMDEGYNVGWFEDDDYCERVKEKGYTCAFTNSSFVYHKGSATMKQIKESDRHNIFKSNQKYFESKWGIKWNTGKNDPKFKFV
jgi:GT2 family glycosyltransferase